MADKSNKSCTGKWYVDRINEFLKLPDTHHECTVWGEYAINKLVKVEIRNYNFADSCIVEAISGEAFSFFKDSETGGPLSCQSVFTDWEENETPVTFWMKDLGE